MELKDDGYGIEALEYILITAVNNIQIKIFVDGLIVLNNKEVYEATMFQEINNLQNASLIDLFTKSKPSLCSFGFLYFLICRMVF